MSGNLCAGCGLKVEGHQESDGVGHLRSEQCISALRAEVARLGMVVLEAKLFDTSGPAMPALPGEVDALTLAFRYLNGIAPKLTRQEYDEFQRRLLAVETAILAALAQREAETVERCVAICAENGGDNGMAIRIARAIRSEFRALAAPATEGTK